MADRYRVGIVGLDHWYAGLAAAESTVKNPRTELVAISHRDPKHLAESAQRFGAGVATTNYREVIERDDIDIVVTACYCSENVEMACEAARRGKHIVSVKPIAMDVAGADAIVKAVKAAKVLFISNESMYRVSPPYQQIKQWIDEGRIGQALSAYATLRCGAPRQPWPGEKGETWWLDPTKTPGGGWLDHSIYYIDGLRWMFGSEIARIGGEVGNLKEKEIAKSLEDFGVANLVFKAGQIGTVEVTWHAAPGAFYSAFNVMGSEGSIAWDMTTSGKLCASGKFGVEGWFQVSPKPGVGTVLDHLVECLDSGKPLAANEDDARTNLAVAMAFYQAARKHSSLDLG